MDFNVDEVREKLTSHRVQVVQELRVDRTLLFDYLRSKAVFDSEDCELVNAEKTNERKASRLLDILQMKATEGLVHFLDVLQLLNPGLYEKLTGQRATARENPIINEVSDKSFTDLNPQRDLDILSNHLKRAVVDLQEMTITYDQLLKENQQLSKRLSKVTDDLDLNSKRLQIAEDQVARAEEHAREAWNNAGNIEETANFQRQECEKAVSDRHTYLLALLMKLCSSEEEAKQSRKDVEEGRKKNEELLCKLQELSQNCDLERNHSRKLSETLSRQRSSVETIESLKDRYRELQFISQKLQMEKDQAISELNELKNWAEALKARYDIAEKNKLQCQESYDNVVVDCSQSRKQIQELQFQLSVSQRQESSTKAQIDELTRLKRKYQEQRDFYNEERLKAINERDEARKERDEMYQQYSDAKKEKDEALKTFLHETREFERRHEKDTAEMRDLRERLVRTEEELKSLKMEWELSLMKRNHSTAKSLRTDNDDDDDEVFSNGNEAVQGRKAINSTELVNSIKTRFYSSSASVMSLDVPGTDAEIFLAQWLSRLPCQALIPVLCPESVKSPSSDTSSAANAESLQELPMKVHCSGEWKDETVGKTCAIDDSMSPEPRPRVNVLDRSRSPRAFSFNTAL